MKKDGNTSLFNRTAYYYYNHCTKRKGDCSQKPLNLEDIETVITESLSQISIDQKTWEMGMKLFRAKHLEESKVNLTHLSHIQKEYRRIQDRLDRLVVMRADEELTRDEFLVQKNSLVERQVKISEKIEASKDISKDWLHEASEFLDTALTAKEIMEGNNFNEKRELILTVGENLILKDKKIDITFKKPYDILIKTKHCSNVLAVWDDFRTSLVAF